jgi:signal transduction histidine kinase
VAAQARDRQQRSDQPALGARAALPGRGLDLKRRVIESLRPTLLDNVGLDAALRWLVDETLRRQGMICEEQYPETMPELTPDARIAVFRVVQECLMNILKHAKAKSVLLRVTADAGKLSVIVRDDGVGIDEARIETPQSHGLLGMRHRVEALDGSLAVRSLGPGVGTELSFQCHSSASATRGPTDEDEQVNPGFGAARPQRLRQC